MSLNNPSDKSIYQEYNIFSKKISHGRITLENWDKVITLRGNCWLEMELNNPSAKDPRPKISIIVRGGDWSIDNKVSNTVRNCATFRYDQMSLGIKEKK